MTTPHLKKSIGRSPSRLAFLLIPLALAWFALSPTAEAALDPSDTAYGTGALANEAGGYSNSAFGYYALYHNTTGVQNTANGVQALYSNTTGGYNTAIGNAALISNTTGISNTAIGNAALYNNTVSYNTAIGNAALFFNTSGTANTATGIHALYSNETGSSNTATGINALYHNTASNNTAYGTDALYSNTTGGYNTANGLNALNYNTTGAQNTATGVNALISNTSGGYNTANGANTLLHNTGANNIGLGYNAGSSLTTGSGNVCIGSGVVGVAAESDTTRIRNIYSSVASGRAVYINSNNKIGTLASTRRVKNDIKPMDKASEAVLALKPVSFRYKKEIDASGTLQFGLVAEEVADVNADLVTRDSEGKPETVRYDAVNAMLLNEFLKEHRKVRDLEKRVEKLTAGLQKVSAQLETSKPAPQVVNNNQ